MKLLSCSAGALARGLGVIGRQQAESLTHPTEDGTDRSAIGMSLCPSGELPRNADDPDVSEWPSGYI